MIIKIKIAFFITLIFGVYNSYGQFDSISIAKSLIKSESILFNNPDSSLWYAENALKIAREIKNKKFIGSSINRIGIAFAVKGDFENSIKYFNQALELCINTSTEKEASIYSNLAIIYEDQGNYVKSLEQNLNALKIREKIGDKERISISLSNIGLLYVAQKEPTKAISYFRKSLEIDNDSNDSAAVSNSLNNLGTAFLSLNMYDSSLNYLNSSLLIQEKLNQQARIAATYNNIGTNYYFKNEYKSAEEYFLKALNIRNDIGDGYGQIQSLTKLNRLYYEIKEYKKAIEFGLIAYNKATEINSWSTIQENSLYISKSFESVGDVNNAFHFYKEYTQSKDSIFNENKFKEIGRLEANFKNEKQKVLDEAENQKKLAVEKEKQERQFIVLIISLTAGFIVIILLVIIYRRLQLTRKQKLIIEEQKEEVESQRDQIEEQRDDIVASITYAKRIQDALLKNEEHENEHFPEHFIFFQPKDIVSGDFYWALEKEQNIYLAAVDCTGHGVPGAFLTLLGTSFLNEINSSLEVLQPAIILDKLRSKIIKELASNGSTKDGMDISLLKLNLKTNEAEWSGANNPLYILRNSDIEIIKGDKEPIGYIENPTKFTNHKFNLNIGDILYLFTDGFADQFGGENGKKLGYKKFREKLLEINNLSLEKQKEELSSFFEQWKDAEYQVDDVCIIGIRI